MLRCQHCDHFVAPHAASMTRQVIDSSAFYETIIPAADTGIKLLPFAELLKMPILCDNIKAGHYPESALRLSDFADWHNSAVS